jgi:hypothetical protein
MCYSEDFGVKLPNKDDYHYYEIANYNDYEYTNSIAYEMVRRTEEFEDLINTPLDKRDYAWEKDLLSLGLSIEDMQYKVDNSNISTPTSFKDKKLLLYQDQASFCISDIENGLNKLIAFYMENKKIYIEVDEVENQSSSKFKQIDNIDILNILYNPDRYFIPCIMRNWHNNIKSKAMCAISHNLPLTMLEEDFLRTLPNKDFKKLAIDIIANFSKPTLRFDESKIINLPLNLNLSEDELKAYISKIKDDYSKENSLVKNSLEIIGRRLDRATNPKSSKKLPKNIKRRKKAMAEAFLVYDIYKILSPIFKQKQKELRTQRDKECKDIRASKYRDKNQKDTKIKEIKKKYQSDINNYSKQSLEDEIVSVTSLNLDKVQSYKKMMFEYIDKHRYKELITGISTK